jgi:hypothetical protein
VKIAGIINATTEWLNGINILAAFEFNHGVVENE